MRIFRKQNMAKLLGTRDNRQGKNEQNPVGSKLLALTPTDTSPENAYSTR